MEPDTTTNNWDPDHRCAGCGTSDQRMFDEHMGTNCVPCQEINEEIVREEERSEL